MATTYSTQLYANNVPANTGHGDWTGSFHLHAVSGSISTWATGDMINVGWLPKNAVVVGAWLKAATQLDTNGAPALTLSLGVTGATTLFKNAITTVGRTAGASADNTVAAAGALYKNTSSAKQAVLVTVGAGAATATAGTLEVDIEFYVEDLGGSNP